MIYWLYLWSSERPIENPADNLDQSPQVKGEIWQYIDTYCCLDMKLSSLEKFKSSVSTDDCTEQRMQLMIKLH